ncbi:hypothetical protein F2Q70_00013307 [Brassica cretica]|uniref:Uncharacterized protein n=1 Tax=Brassica cretica TaxID=69181 RepID=A0A8S9L6D2_BRACR|nr:hypothetical protein F2Q70_00027767 [Brassica cretica]KAF2613969.1 hypothetical protein F2Q70_00013307 [Brassica cretica]
MLPLDSSKKFSHRIFTRTLSIRAKKFSAGLKSAVIKVQIASLPVASSQRCSLVRESGNRMSYTECETAVAAGNVLEAPLFLLNSLLRLVQASRRY